MLKTIKHKSRAERKHKMKGKLTVWQSAMYPFRWNWEMVWRGLYIASWTKNDYTTKRGARKAALRAAKKLSIEITETK